MPEITTTTTLIIDGRAVGVHGGDTVLDAARRAGIHIPTLCAHKDLSPFGACRLCIVEIDGVRGYPTSCTTPAAPGMVVRTQTPELEALRNTTLELMLSGHPNACLVCDHREECDRASHPNKSGQSTRCGACSNSSACSIRGMALERPASALNLPTLYSRHKVERDDPFIERDHNLCVLCGRCWRICEQLHGTAAISIINRGDKARIGTAFGRSWVESGCTFCGACVDICPTGTLTDRYARWYTGPRREVESVCQLCDEACSMTLVISEDQVVATGITEFKRPARLCALGRFAYAQMLASPARLRQPMVREEGELTPVPWDEAIATVATALKEFQGKFAIVAGEPLTREARGMYELLAENMKGRLVLVSASGSADELPADFRDELTNGSVEALWVAGDYVGERLLEKLKYLVAADFLPSLLTTRADAVFPVAVLAEAAGSMITPAGELKSVPAAAPAPGSARPEPDIVRDLCAAMGITLANPDVSSDFTPAAPISQPRDRVADLPRRFRGHRLADIVPGLQGFEKTPPCFSKTGRDKDGAPSRVGGNESTQLTGFRVVARDEIVPNFHRLVVEAPTVAHHAKPGQFAILMVGQRSERAPFTLVDWDKEAGTITLVIEEVGRSSQEITRLKPGDLVAHVSGPLGLPLPVEGGRTVVLGGGCYGIGAIFPIARALKQAGSKVVAAIEACTAHMLYMEQELRSVCDRLYIATKDGSRGRKGGVQDVFMDLQKAGIKIDQYVAVGCTFMMRQVAKKTDAGIPLQVSLNPIMVDGTGMCGACRVAVGSETKFACVNGPFFDGRLVDWAELASRRNAYVRREVEAMHTPLDGNAAMSTLTVL
jgi:NAD(P)H-flavin reductase/ferredoxin